ncbi:hypothetical protein BA062_11520 [Prauserella flavalba]|uniref:ANTAR domain-containing protein n=1 Tax=Prauserella flavalba TaxID=1477506 RepID=A0A318LXF4_9PSEU|nr:hypothetical protein BA062_11520 [Prauserella flavalba]
MIQLDEVATALRLLHDEMSAAEPLERALCRVTAGAVAAVPDARHASVTLLDDGQLSTAAATAGDITELEHVQYVVGRGPCVLAATTRRVVRAVAGSGPAPWPEFAEAAHGAGLRAALSVPLVVAADDEPMWGSLNLYSGDETAFDPFDESLMGVFTVAASAAICNARRWQRSLRQVEQLEFALVSRADIEQAKGVLMALHGCSADEAFLLLAHESQVRNTKLREVARELLTSLRRR